MIHGIKGQAVKFVENGQDFNTRNRKCTGYNLDICQPVIKGVYTRFQVLLGKKTGTQLLTNSEFLTDLSDWSPGEAPGISEWSSKYGGSVYMEGGGIIQNQEVSLNPNSYYYAEAKFRDTEAPNSVNPAWTLLDSAPLGYTGSGESNLIGDRIARIWFESGSATSTFINVSTRKGYVEYVRLWEITIPEATVKDSAGNDAFTPDIQLFEDRAIITVNWNNAPADEGIYTVCVAPKGDVGINHVACQDAIIDGSGDDYIDDEGVCIIAP